MRIAIVSRATADGGGASRVAEDVYHLLAGEPQVSVDHYVRSAVGDPLTPYRILSQSLPIRVATHAGSLAGKYLGLPGYLDPPSALFAWNASRNYDVIHFHDTSETFSPLAMRWLAKRRPVLWTFHDMSPITGGCIYSMDCTRYQSTCGNCPQLGQWPIVTNVDRTRWMQSYKQTTAKSHRIVAVAPSNWLVEQASSWGGYQHVEKVPYSVDLHQFRPRDRSLLEKQLLPVTVPKFRVLVAAHSLDDPRKGVAMAFAALRKLACEVEVVLIGQPSAKQEELVAGLNVFVAGFVRDRELLAKYYSLCDVFLFPSLADNLPCSIIEAMACGTPTIAFRVGGIPDLVVHNTNGFLCDAGDVDGLASALTMTAGSPELLQRWSEACRDIAIENHSPERALNQHLQLYQRAISGHRRMPNDKVVN